MLNLEISEEQQVLLDSFAKFFADHSSIARVRAAEPLGFDAALHHALSDMGAFGLRVSEDAGGLGASLFDAVLLAELAGRHLAAAPLAETIIAARLLAELGGAGAAGLLADVLSGKKVITLALHEVQADVPQIVPAGAVADFVVALDGDAVQLIRLSSKRPSSSANHGSQPIANLVLKGAGDAGEATRLASGPEARSAFLAGLEEWKLLIAAQLNGLSRRALEYAVAYAKERLQFGRPIGSFQAIAHPLADRAIDVDAAQLFTWWSVEQITKNRPDAAAAIAMSFWWSCKTADETTRCAIHTHGGYGVTLEYDLQLFFRRAKAWPLVLGDPKDQLVEGGRRLWLDAFAPLPPAGEMTIDFDFGEEAEALARETRELLGAITTPEWREQAHYSYAGHDPQVFRQIGERGLVHPLWPVEWGGRGAHPYAAALALSTWQEFNVTTHAQATTRYVGAVLLAFASEELKREVLLDIGKGLKTSSLGYSEPSSGSDVFAARTRAIWDEDNKEWVINGQKMFTSGAEVNDYVLLITRTDPNAPKHAGITLFLAPLKTPGVEVHAVHTVQDERTNATFYADVRLPDRYRLGEVNGSAKALAEALKLEHGSNYQPGDHDLIDIVLEWARRPDPDGRSRLQEKDVLARLARTKAHAYLIELISKRTMYFGVTYPDRRTAYGPMNKLFKSETYQSDMTDLIDLTAPYSLFRSNTGLGQIELGHRHAQVSTIYGGTSEVHRSMVAEIGLGLPRSR